MLAITRQYFTETIMKACRTSGHKREKEIERELQYIII